MELHVEHNDANAAWGNVGPVFLVMWKRGLRPDALEGFANWSNAKGARITTGWVVLSYPTPRMELPSPEMRQRITEFTSNPAMYFMGTTTVVDAEGFSASILRSVLAGLSLMGGKGAPRHVSRSSDEAVEYLATVLAFDVEAVKRGVRAFVAQARGT